MPIYRVDYDALEKIARTQSEGVEEYQEVEEWFFNEIEEVYSHWKEGGEKLKDMALRYKAAIYAQARQEERERVGGLIELAENEAE